MLVTVVSHRSDATPAESEVQIMPFSVQMPVRRPIETFCLDYTEEHFRGVKGSILELAHFMYFHSSGSQLPISSPLVSLMLIYRIRSLLAAPQGDV